MLPFQSQRGKCCFEKKKKKEEQNQSKWELYKLKVKTSCNSQYWNGLRKLERPFPPFPLKVLGGLVEPLRTCKIMTLGRAMAQPTEKTGQQQRTSHHAPSVKGQLTPEPHGFIVESSPVFESQGQVSQTESLSSQFLKLEIM